MFCYLPLLVASVNGLSCLYAPSTAIATRRVSPPGFFTETELPGIVHPDLINEPGETLDSSFVLPDAALRDVPGVLRSDAERG